MSQFPNTERGVRRNANNIPITYGESPASGPAPTTAGHHKHDVLNKLDPRVDSTQDRRPMPQENVPAGTYGPHRSRIANILDPRVDSDADHRAAAHAPHHTAAGGLGAAGAGPAMHGATAQTAGHGTGRGMGGFTSGAGTGAPEGTYGPHNSRVANAMDPRVDSDMDNRARLGGAGGAGGYPTGAAAAGATGPGYGPGPVGPGGTGGGFGQQLQQQHVYAHGATGGGHHGLGNQAGNHGMMSGPGPAPNTAGPHRSDLLNKLDPRVDSKTGLMKTTERRGI